MGTILAASSLAMIPWTVHPMGRFVRTHGVRYSMIASLLLASISFVAIVPCVLAAHQM